MDPENDTSPENELEAFFIEAAFSVIKGVV
jgi:hypothetical protein